MKRSTFLFILVLLVIQSEGQNLVPNPSFEEVKRKTRNWSTVSDAFSALVREWTSPTQGSPDILYEGVLGKMFPKRPKIDMTLYSPRSGKFMTGIKTYGCTAISLHCKEYMQVKLSNSLKRGEQYYFEYWVNPVVHSVKVNSFGIGLSVKGVKESHDGLIGINPISMQDEVIHGDSINEWHKVSGVFESLEDHNYLIIGNFSADESIEFIKEKESLEYGFYLVDDVLLKHLPKENDQELKENENIVLENILFEFDRAILQESSHPELDVLVVYLHSNNDCNLKIMGHTDSKGSTDYNMKLSQERANTIKEYLVSKGIEESRIHPIGLGKEYPIIDNDSDESRKINRRVEIKIIPSPK